jgi:hypothetical protein
MTLGLTQPISTRKLSVVLKSGRRVGLTTSPPSMSGVSRQCRSPRSVTEETGWGPTGPCGRGEGQSQSPLPDTARGSCFLNGALLAYELQTIRFVIPFPFVLHISASSLFMGGLHLHCPEYVMWAVILSLAVLLSLLGNVTVRVCLSQGRMNWLVLLSRLTLYSAMVTIHTTCFNTQCICVPYGSHNKQRLFPQTALTGWAL